MTARAPMSEPDFDRFLSENGCCGERKGKEFAAYRKSDGKFVSSYAVDHGGGKREVKPIYSKNFLKALAVIKQQEGVDGSGLEKDLNDESWKEAEWYVKQNEAASELTETVQAEGGDE
ncbi:MAG: hypothetical protein WC028_26960 [Candidatus Obscuribacterales bacterium]